MARIVANPPFESRKVVTRRGDRALLAGMGGTTRSRSSRARSGRGRDQRLIPPERLVRGPLPRAARPEHRIHQGLQAALDRRRVLARRREEQDAAARLRDRVREARRPRGAPEAHRGGEGARPPEARQGARALLLQPDRARRARSSSRRAPSSTTASSSTCASSTARAATRRSSLRRSSSRLFKRSGHWDHYQDNMYFTEKEEQKYAVKPMNCPGPHLRLRVGEALLPRAAAPDRGLRPRSTATSAPA